jgi:hypothetical protein
LKIQGEQPATQQFSLLRASKWWPLINLSGIFSNSPLRQASVPENVVMQLTGHMTRSVFDRYDIVDPRDRAVSVGQLAAFHAQNSRLRDNHGTISTLPSQAGTVKQWITH